MAVLHLVLLTIWISHASIGEDSEVCRSPQYLQFGSRDIIQCSFRGGYYGILWYNSTYIDIEDPVLELVDSVKSGEGYISGEYDILPDGSLIINNVSATHDQMFTVVKFNSLVEEPLRTTISVVTVVDPEEKRLVFKGCGLNSAYCLKTVDSTFAVDCICRKARPAVRLKLAVRTSYGDRYIRYKENVTAAGDVTYTSIVTTTDIFHYSPFLSLLVCKATVLPGMLNTNESLILIQNKELEKSPVKTLQRYVALGSELNLVCTNQTVLFLTWQKGSFGDDKHDLIVHAVFPQKQYIDGSFDSYELTETGSLVLARMNVKQEGYYICLYGDGLTNGITKYEVLAYAFPDPPHPVVEGCGNQKFCPLQSSIEGNLTCSIKGIRPKVSLEWTVGDTFSDMISFETQVFRVQRHAETFSVTLTSLFRVLDTSLDRVIVKCQISGLQMDIFKDAITVELLIQNQRKGEDSDSVISKLHWKILIGTGISFPWVAIVGFVLYKGLARLTCLKKEASQHRTGGGGRGTF